jgi:hypothetical protein
LKRLSTLVACLLVASASAQAPSAIATTVGIDTIVTNIRNGLSELISQTEVGGTAAGFSFATDAKILLQNFESLGKSLSGKVFGDLNASQQAIFSNALVALDKTNKTLEKRLSDAATLVASAGGELSRVPGFSRRPLLSKYSPSYVLNAEADYDITFMGSLLNSPNSTLMFGKESCRLVSSIETEVRFTCPATAFDDDRNKWQTGRLTLRGKKPWYAFWRDDGTYDYQVAVMVIQEKLADFKLSVTETRPTQSNVARSASNGHRNGHCRGDRDVFWPQRPAADCKINVTSIRDSHRMSESSTYNGIVNASSEGFAARGVVRNRGRCGPAGIGRDARGSLNLTVEWTETCSTGNKEFSLAEQVGEILWNEEKSFQLSPLTTKFVLTITQANGQIKVIDRAMPERWFSTTYDPNSKVLIVKPRELLEALK